LLKKVDSQQDFLQQAKDLALRILQNTVYSMVNNIGACRETAVQAMSV